MLSYRHQFHAGCVADVFKHALLTRLVMALTRKDKPFFLLDTHAGLGRYDLSHAWSMKTGEWQAGIGRIWERQDAPDVLDAYLNAVRSVNQDGRLKFYPGSPWIARQLMRDQDRLALTELNQDDCAALARQVGTTPNTAVQRMDGFKAIKAYLPPKERRGLLFLDAAFDQQDEFERLLRAMKTAHARFPTGVIAIWHPLMAPDDMEEFTTEVRKLGLPATLRLALSTRPAGWTETMRGSALIVANTPYGFDAEARPMIDWLWQALTPEGEGAVEMDWLVAPT